MIIFLQPSNYCSILFVEWQRILYGSDGNEVGNMKKQDDTKVRPKGITADAENYFTLGQTAVMLLERNPGTVVFVWQKKNRNIAEECFDIFRGHYHQNGRNSVNFSRFDGAADRTRIGTVFLPKDFKAYASKIKPYKNHKK